jgi:CheY-like chemotaxis protein
MIIMDLQMPVLDGLAATEYVRQHMYHGSTIPIIAVSSFGTYYSPPVARAFRTRLSCSISVFSALSFFSSHANTSIS